MDGKWCKVAISWQVRRSQQPDTWVHTPRESRHDVAARCLHRPLPSVRPNDRVRSACNFWMPIDNKSAQSPALCGLRGKGLERGFGILGYDGQEGASGRVR